MLNLFLLLLVGCCLLSVVARDHALVAMAIIGFTQDPFRKLVTGEPIFFIVMVGIVFGLMFLATINRVGLVRASEPFVGWTQSTRRPLALFLLVLFAQMMHSYLRYGNIVISLIGLMSYIAPFFAIVVGYYSINRSQDIRRFMKFYVVAGIVLTTTVWMSFAGFDWSIFREVGYGLKIYDQGTVLRSHSGFMRTGEIAAWHLATAGSFLIILYATSNRKPPLLMVIGLVIFILGAIAFTGRRKMLMLFSMFGIFYALGYLYFRRTLAVGYLVAGATIVLIGWLGVELLFPGGYGSDVQNYLSRGSSVYGDASTRFVDLGLRPVTWAYNRVGLLGGGLGIASQGTQFFQNTNIAGGSGEGGLGKVMVELGLPGLLVATWMILTFATYIKKSISLSAQQFVPLQLMPLMLGISVLLSVNVLTFAIATQVYGDMFILLMLGVMAGFVFALPKLVIRAMAEQQNAQHLDTPRYTSVTQVNQL